jgi:tripartite-type tricarboxylate transporter receptor subunit TctC
VIPSMRSIWAVAAAFALASTADAAVPAFPQKAVRVIVPFPAGGTADAVPRILAEKLRAKWGQTVMVENRPGAGGNIGAAEVARAEPDGYTLISSPPGPLAINGSLYKNLSYDPLKFVSVSVVATMPNVLAVRTTLPATSVRQLIDTAKASPGKLTYASQGNGTTSHLTAHMFQQMAGVKMIHVPYKGTAPALTDLIGGRVDLFFDNISSSLSQYRAGRIKVLAVATRSRIPALPDVPTLAESGLPGFQAGTWMAFAAPPNTPAPIAATISRAIAEAVQDPEVRRRLAELGAEPIGSSPEEMARFVQDEATRWRKVIESANVTVE